MYAPHVHGQVNLCNPYMSSTLCELKILDYVLFIVYSHRSRLIHHDRGAKERLVSDRTMKLLIPMGYFRVVISSAFSSCTNTELCPERHKTALKKALVAMRNGLHNVTHSSLKFQMMRNPSVTAHFPLSNRNVQV